MADKILHKWMGTHSLSLYLSLCLLVSLRPKIDEKIAQGNSLSPSGMIFLRKFINNIVSSIVVFDSDGELSIMKKIFFFILFFYTTL